MSLNIKNWSGYSLICLGNVLTSLKLHVVVITERDPKRHENLWLEDVHWAPSAAAVWLNTIILNCREWNSSACRFNSSPISSSCRWRSAEPSRGQIWDSELLWTLRPSVSPEVWNWLHRKSFSSKDINLLTVNNLCCVCSPASALLAASDLFHLTHGATVLGSIIAIGKFSLTSGDRFKTLFFHLWNDIMCVKKQQEENKDETGTKA